MKECLSNNSETVQEIFQYMVVGYFENKSLWISFYKLYRNEKSEANLKWKFSFIFGGNVYRLFFSRKMFKEFESCLFLTWLCLNRERESRLFFVK